MSNNKTMTEPTTKKTNAWQKGLAPKTDKYFPTNMIFFKFRTAPMRRHNTWSKFTEHENNEHLKANLSSQPKQVRSYDQFRHRAVSGNTAL